MFKVSWQDFRYHRFGDKLPPIQTESFVNKEDADARAKELRNNYGMLVCVTPHGIKHNRLSKDQMSLTKELFNLDWKLHK